MKTILLIPQPRAKMPPGWLNLAIQLMPFDKIPEIADNIHFWVFTTSVDKFWKDDGIRRR